MPDQSTPTPNPPDTSPPNPPAQPIPIALLDDHPANSNVMPKALFDKLAGEIERTGLYPPVIVRPVGERYQILDGHHRVAALRRLGREHAQAVVWQADDDQALVLLATLNRLSGSDDPRKRAALIARLHQSMDLKTLAQRLPEDRGKVSKLLQLHAAPPSPKPPQPLSEMPVSLHFFLLPEQRRAIERRLAEHGGPRERALMELLGIASNTEAPDDE